MEAGGAAALTGGAHFVGELLDGGPGDGVEVDEEEIGDVAVTGGSGAGADGEGGGLAGGAADETVAEGDDFRSDEVAVRFVDGVPAEECRMAVELAELVAVDGEGAEVGVAAAEGEDLRAGLLGGGKGFGSDFGDEGVEAEGAEFGEFFGRGAVEAEGKGGGRTRGGAAGGEEEEKEKGSAEAAGLEAQPMEPIALLRLFRDRRPAGRRPGQARRRSYPARSATMTSPALPLP